MTTTGLPGAGWGGAAGTAVCNSKPSKARRIDIRFDRRRALAGDEHAAFEPGAGAQKIVRDDSSEWIIDVRGDEVTRQ